MTTNDNLADLVEKANRLFSMRGRTHRVDRSLVDLRNGLAHGRLAVTSRPDIRIVIWRFSAPRAQAREHRAVSAKSPNQLFASRDRERSAGGGAGILFCGVAAHFHPVAGFEASGASPTVCLGLRLRSESRFFLAHSSSAKAACLCTCAMTARATAGSGRSHG